MPKPTPIQQKLALASRLKEARRNRIYWQRQCELRTDPKAQRAAGASMLVWKYQAEHIERELAALGAEPATAS